MEQLISQPFTYEYFKDIFINQFVRIIYVFMKKITLAVKHKSLTDLDLLDCTDCN